MNIKKFLFILHFLFFISSVKAINYSDEIIKSYDWAYDNKITTQSPIDNANIYWEITRIELAKMISNYAINVLWNNIESQDECEFVDVSKDLDEQYNFWVLKSCQLWLMGQWIKYFRPYDKVTRAEFWTILSRTLFWNEYNSKDNYYNRHLTVLNSLNIIKDINNPINKIELRWYVFLMLKRSIIYNNLNIQEVVVNKNNLLDTVIQTWDILIYDNRYYWFNILFGKNRKWSKIINHWKTASSYDNNWITIYFPLDNNKLLTEQTYKKGVTNNDYPIINLDIINKEYFENLSDVSRSYFAWVPYKLNNKYIIYVIYSPVTDSIIHKNFSEIECIFTKAFHMENWWKDWLCPNFFNDYFFNNIEMKKPL